MQENIKSDVYTWAHAQQTPTPTHTHTYSNILTHTHTYSHILTHTHTYSHILTHTHTCTHMHTHAHTCTQRCTNAHTSPLMYTSTFFLIQELLSEFSTRGTFCDFGVSVFFHWKSGGFDCAAYLFFSWTHILDSIGLSST